MGYCGCMGYEVFFPVIQLSGLKNLWDKREYGVTEPWVTRELTEHGLEILGIYAIRCICNYFQVVLKDYMENCAGKGTSASGDLVAW